MIELPEDLAEQIADWCGIHGIGDSLEGNEYKHSEKYHCRMCFVGMIEHRIRESCDNELALEIGGGV